MTPSTKKQLFQLGAWFLVVIAFLAIFIIIGVQKSEAPEELPSVESFLTESAEKINSNTQESSVGSSHEELEQAASSISNPPSFSEVQTSPYDALDNTLTASRVVLCNVTDGEVLYTKNASKKCFPASLTKLLTAILAVDAMPQDTVITVGNEILMVGEGSSIAYLGQGQKLYLSTLIEALLISSGNDAAYTIAVNVARYVKNDNSLSNEDAVAYFCALLNAKAQTFGCTGTHFVNPDGYHDENHYTTANDLLLIAKKAMEYELIRKAVGTPSVAVKIVSGQQMNWVNTNKLLTSYRYATGMKTGTTNEAGPCLAASAQYGGKEYIAILLGCSDNNSRFSDAMLLFDTAFALT